MLFNTCAEKTCPYKHVFVNVKAYICEVTFARLHMRICMCMCSPMGVPAALVGGWSRGGPGHRGEYSGPRCYAAQNRLPECETVQDTQCACSVLEIPERVEWKCFEG